jgi:hypothetical protein
LEAFEGILDQIPTRTLSQTQATQIAPSDCEVFAKLPMGIMEAILEFLPTASVKALRLSSRSVAYCGLSNKFWKSRFVYPHEQSHIPLHLSLRIPFDLPRQAISSPLNENHIDWKALRQSILEPEEQELRYMDRGTQLKRNWKRISSIARELSRALLREILKERGGLIIWHEGRFKDHFKRKMLSIDATLTTSCDHVIFSDSLRLEDVVEIVVMYEQLRDGMDRPLVDGIEFRFDHDYGKE